MITELHNTAIKEPLLVEEIIELFSCDKAGKPMYPGYWRRLWARIGGRNRGKSVWILVGMEKVP